MSVKEKLHHLIDELSEDRAARLLQDLKADREEFVEDSETPEDFFAKHGTWQDDRTTEEIIRDIYESRTISTRHVEL